MIRLEIIDQQGQVRQGRHGLSEVVTPMANQGEKAAFLAMVDFDYQEGDRIRVTTSGPNQFVVAKFDETLAPAIVLLANSTWEYEIPLSESARKSIPNTAFMAKRRSISVRYAKDFEVTPRRNLAYNTHDQKENTGAYPHASANVETRNDSTFFAKNAIDGTCTNNDHGPFPFQSWGINRDPNAELTIDFGREVTIDTIGLVLRADYPHDSYWTQVSLRFSNGNNLTFNTTNAIEAQEFSFPPEKATSITLHSLIKAEDESPFPALTQIEVYGQICYG